MATSSTPDATGVASDTQPLDLPDARTSDGPTDRPGFVQPAALPKGTQRQRRAWHMLAHCHAVLRHAPDGYGTLVLQRTDTGLGPLAVVAADEVRQAVRRYLEADRAGTGRTWLEDTADLPDGLRRTLDAVGQTDLWLELQARPLDLLAERMRTGHRGRATDPVVLSVLWQDVDLHATAADRQAHKSPRPCPPSWSLAVDAIRRTQSWTDPWLLDSGHGLWTYLALDRGLAVTPQPDGPALVESVTAKDTRTELDALAVLLPLWASTQIRQEYRARDWHLDKVSDLARCARLAGTQNLKVQPATATGWRHRTSAVELDGLLAAMLAELDGQDVATAAAMLDAEWLARPEPLVDPSPRPPATPSRTLDLSGPATDTDGPNVLAQTVDRMSWQDIWPDDWQRLADSTVNGQTVELYKRPGATSPYSVRCWPDAGCHVHSDAVNRLPAGPYSRAQIVAWRYGYSATDVAALAKDIYSGRLVLPGQTWTPPEPADRTGGQNGQTSDGPDAGTVDLAEAPADEQTATGELYSRATLEALHLVPFADRLHSAPQEWLVEGLLPVGSLALLYGLPGCGKSLFALALAVEAAAAGRSVIYSAAEGVPRLGDRVQALLAATGRSWQEIAPRFRWTTRPPDLGTAAGQQWLDRLLPLLDVDLLVVDTLAAHSSGDENDNAAMDRALRPLRNATADGTTTLALHHLGKDASRGPRGASALFGALDTAIACSLSTKELEPGVAGRLELEDKKQRDAAGGRSVQWNLRQVEIERPDGTRAQGVAAMPGLFAKPVKPGGRKRSERRQAADAAVAGPDATVARELLAADVAAGLYDWRLAKAAYTAVAADRGWPEWTG